MNITLIHRIIFTLKQLDVRGYDSMDKLVGVVSLLEKIVEQAEKEQEEKQQEQPTEG